MQFTAQSYLELMTTVFGWYNANRFSMIFLFSGIVLIPFIQVVYENIKKPSESQEAKDAWSTSLNKMRWDLLTMAVVMVIAFYPISSHPLQPILVDKDTGKKAEVTMTEAKTVVPVYWWIVMGAANGLTRSFISILPELDDVRLIKAASDDIHISDPILRNEIRAFRNMCFLPARAKFINYSLDGRMDGPALLEEYGESGFGWIGGQGLRETPGLYPPCTTSKTCGSSLRATQPIAGWPQTEFTMINGRAYYRDVDEIYRVSTYKSLCAGLTDQACKTKIIDPIPGKPMCSEWWDDKQHGIKQKVIDYTGTSGLVKMYGLSGTWDSLWETDDLENTMVRKVLAQTPKTVVSNDLAWNSSAIRTEGFIKDPVASANRFGTNVLKEGASLVGTTMAGGLTSISVYPMLQTLPIIQNYLLFALYVSVPFLLIIGKYDVVVVWYLTIAIVTIKFWSGLWATAQWLDQIMLAAATGGSLSGLGKPEFLLRVLNGQQSIYNLIEMVSMFMYLAFPLLFTTFMGVIGYKGAQSMSKMTNVSDDLGQGAEDSGKFSSDQVKKAASPSKK